MRLEINVNSLNKYILEFYIKPSINNNKMENIDNYNKNENTIENTIENTLNIHWIQNILGYSWYLKYPKYPKYYSKYAMFVNNHSSLNLLNNLLPKRFSTQSNNLNNNCMNVCICCRQKFGCSFRLGVCPSCHQSLLQPTHTNNQNQNKILSIFK